MKTLVVLLILAVAAWGGWRHFRSDDARAGAPPRPALTTSSAPAVAPGRPEVVPGFTCDGRTHCSQMRSCEEATDFLRHCPDTKMDGDRDGVACERQWCG